MKKYTVTKPHSPNIIEITQRDSEGWFYDVLHKTKKSKKIVSDSMITAKDVPVWLAQYERNGFSVVESDGSKEVSEITEKPTKRKTKSKKVKE
jgi:hypothetical protein